MFKLQRSLVGLSNNVMKSQIYTFSNQIKPPHPSEKAETFTTESLNELNYTLPHPHYTQNELDQIQIDHKQVLTIGDRFANWFVNSMRIGFDVMSGYRKVFPWQTKEITEQKWLNRVIFLETVAAVPGFAGAMHRHLNSLRYMKRDYGWIHTLLEEAENERVHLLTFMNLKQPSLLFRMGVMLAQFYYVGIFSVLYMLIPRVCHRIVGYLEEQAVKTYSIMIDEIKKPNSSISHWKNIPASKLSINYWGLEETATLLDVVKAIRKDEEHHKVVNHLFADDYTQKSKNSIPPGF